MSRHAPSLEAGEPGVDRSEPPAPGPLRPFHFPPIDRTRLDNGLGVVSVRTSALPVVTLSLLVDAGGLHESEERAGLASLTSGLLESGAGDRDAAEIADDLERIGMQLGVGTSWDVSHLDVTGLTSSLPEAAAILADLARRPTFPAGEVERLKHEQLAAILQRRAEPRGLANEVAALRIFAAESPFSRPLGGTTTSVESLSPAEIAAFHAARFTPRGATLVVVGDLAPEKARALAEEHFGDWRGGAPPPAAPTVRPRARTRQLVVADRPGAVQSEIRVGHLGVDRGTEDFFPILVMNAILGGAFSSRLNLNLRERHGFTYGVSSAFVMRRHPGPFVVSTAVQTEVTAKALAEILREIRAIREAPVSADELGDARSYLAGIFPLRLQTTEGIASRLAEMLIHDLPPDYFDSYRQRIAAVTAEEVQRVAQAHLRPDELAVVVAGDAGAVRGPLEEMGLGAVEVVDGPEGA